jgi:hypothetical protein
MTIEIRQYVDVMVPERHRGPSIDFQGPLL